MNVSKAGFGADLKALLTAWRPELLEAFSQPCFNRPWFAQYPRIVFQKNGRYMSNSGFAFDDLGIVVDKQKNVWGSYRVACVSTPRQVIALKFPPPEEAPRPTNDNSPFAAFNPPPRVTTGVALVGDGEYVFYSLADGRSFFVHLGRSDVPDFIRGPNLLTGGDRSQRLSDRQGGLWLNVQPVKQSGDECTELGLCTPPLHVARRV